MNIGVDTFSRNTCGNLHNFHINIIEIEWTNVIVLTLTIGESKLTENSIYIWIERQKDFGKYRFIYESF